MITRGFELFAVRVDDEEGGNARRRSLALVRFVIVLS
jgi:hypothetical protein